MGGRSMNTYVCFYGSKKIEVKAETQLQARDKAAKEFKVKRAFEVTAILVEADGEAIAHTPDF